MLSNQDGHSNEQRLAWQVEMFCHAVGISSTKFYELVKKGKIKTIVVGGRRLVPDAEVRRIIAYGV